MSYSPPGVTVTFTNHAHPSRMDEDEMARNVVYDAVASGSAALLYDAIEGLVSGRYAWTPYRTGVTNIEAHVWIDKLLAPFGLRAKQLFDTTDHPIVIRVQLEPLDEA